MDVNTNTSNTLHKIQDDPKASIIRCRLSLADVASIVRTFHHVGGTSLTNPTMDVHVSIKLWEWKDWAKGPVNEVAAYLVALATSGIDVLFSAEDFETQTGNHMGDDEEECTTALANLLSGTNIRDTDILRILCHTNSGMLYRFIVWDSS
jgi:hypothetical protein